MSNHPEITGQLKIQGFITGIMDRVQRRNCKAWSPLYIFHVVYSGLLFERFKLTLTRFKLTCHSQ